MTTAPAPLAAGQTFTIPTSTITGISGGTMGAWIEALAAGTFTRPVILTGWSARASLNSGDTWRFHIGVGPAGSEVLISDVGTTGVSSAVFRDVDWPIGFWLPANTRVAARSLLSTGSGYSVTGLQLKWREAPVGAVRRAARQWSGVPFTTKPAALVYPASDAAAVSIPYVSSDFGAWTQVVPAATFAFDVLVTGVMTTGTGLTFQVGVGAAAAEVIAGQTSVSQSDAPSIQSLAVPVLVPAGARIALRSQNVSGGASTIGCRLIYARI